ncbi:EAL domain-containing protein [Sphingomonas jeddahensis]|uniref:Phytochrome-like protein cph2 n=1 Tax=Sphingomonas jeddahensis TaxID=1915074 RepID=A0A1V2EU95_9SPHN|nr:EAL domain-containing protein [Sphingomonas jeddahensis]ONF96067.1 Phytochrome-like protein cph2 [Sphingomonas jeddahensis]
MGRIRLFSAAAGSEPLKDEGPQWERLVREFESSGKGWFWQTQADSTISYISDKAAHALGREPHELIGQSLSSCLAPDEPFEVGSGHRSLAFYLSTRVPFEEIVMRARTPAETWWSISGSPSFDHVGRFLGYAGFVVDLTAARQAEIHLHRLARYDSLTGLANRDVMQQSLIEALRSAARRKEHLTLALLDLDHFKAVNDTLGHPVGDALLKLVASRLKETVGNLGRVGRIGGDEFEIILPNIYDEEDLGAFCKRVITSLSKPYYIGSDVISIGATIGLAVSGYDVTDADEIVRNADLALYSAKAAGRGTFKFFAPEMLADAQERRNMEFDLRSALAENQFSVVYQPSVHIGTQRLSGFEALIRWNHPDRGPVSPDVFIPLAEEIGLIAPIGEWVLRAACAEAASWPQDLRVAVNLSPLQCSSASLPALIAGVLSSTGLPANRLELEITEGVVLANNEQTYSNIASLKSLGVKIALDDFGTGYSSLGYLRTVAFDKIKIDKSFVAGAVAPGSKNAPIIRAVVSLASELGMESTAEGVESQDELALVRQLGCDYVQGYIYGKPMAATEARLLANEGATPAANGFLRFRNERRRLIRAAEVKHSGKTIPARVRNISSGGALLECEEVPPIGAHITVHLSAGPTYDAEVRWVRANLAGVEFSAAIDLSDVRRPSQSTSTLPVMPDYLRSKRGINSLDTLQKKRFTPRDLRD